MAIRSPMMRTVVAGALLWIAGCSEPESGPIAVSAIGDPPSLVNHNLKRLAPASAFLIEAAAQGPVQVHAHGPVQPAVAASWGGDDDRREKPFRPRHP